jgi:hypothetical protein
MVHHNLRVSNGALQVTWTLYIQMLAVFSSLFNSILTG